MKNKTALFSSNTDEWATPQDFFDKLDAEFHFTLDPCATPENAKCRNFYTKTENGLAKNWGGELCSVTRRMAKKYRSGFKRLTRKVGNRIHGLFCLFRHERTPDIFMNIFTTKQRKSDSFEEG